MLFLIAGLAVGGAWAVWGRIGAGVAAFVMCILFVWANASGKNK